MRVHNLGSTQLGKDTSNLLCLVGLSKILYKWSKINLGLALLDLT